MSYYRGNPEDMVDALGDLLETFRRPAWHQKAACRGMGPDLFFPEVGGRTDEAKALCASCPVRSACLEAARTSRETSGVWGGLSSRERRSRRPDAA